jgi:hypothetical protein
VDKLCIAYKAKQKAVKNCQQSRLKSRRKKLSTKSSKKPPQKMCLKSRCKKIVNKAIKSHLKSRREKLSTKPYNALGIEHRAQSIEHRV